MDIKQLEYFTVVYQSQNFTAAAKKIHISQQGLSKSIQNLENEFSTPLFLRNKKRLIPTPFGELMYNQAVHLIEEFQKALETLEKAK